MISTRPEDKASGSVGFEKLSQQLLPYKLKWLMPGKGRVIHVCGEYLPLIALHEIFGIMLRITEPQQGIVVLLDAERKNPLYSWTNWSDSTRWCMGDGKVAMILDIGALMSISQSQECGTRGLGAGGNLAQAPDISLAYSL